MAETSWPFFGQETNETQFSKWARAFAASGIVSGLALTAGAGMNLTVGTGSALVRGVYYENNTAPATKPVTAAPSSGQRLDAIILRLDQSANTITAQVKAGTTALPSLQQDEDVWEYLIGFITIPAGTVSLTNAMITSLLPSTGVPVLPYSADSRRPTPDRPFAIGVNTTAKRIDLWTGAEWVNLSHLDNMSGILPVSKGGSGAGDAIGARTNLEVVVQATAPEHSPGRLWVKVPA